MTTTLTLLNDAALTQMTGGAGTSNLIPFSPGPVLPLHGFGDGDAHRFGPCPNPDAFPKPAPNPDPFPVQPFPFHG